MNAYNDVVAQNRMKIPNEIEINVDTFNDTTVDGQNENELLERFSTLVSSERDAELATCVRAVLSSSVCMAELQSE